MLALLGILVGWGMDGMAYAGGVTFQATDNPGSWFECDVTTSNSTSLGCVHNILGDSTVGKSLAVIKRGESITFQSGGGRANTIHTVVSLIYPTPAKGPLPKSFTKMPFDTDLDVGGTSAPIVPNELGLHVFFCDIHPYMFATVIVVDPALPSPLPLDLGKTLDLPRVTSAGIKGLPTASDLALRLVHTFFIATNPKNWQDYRLTEWTPSYPGVPVVAYVAGGGPVPLQNLDIFLRQYFREGGTGTVIPTDCPLIAAPVGGECPRKSLAAPSMAGQTAGIGEVWVDTQFETILSEKSKPGTATAVNVANGFTVVKKIALPTINDGGEGMNNPHNMWTDKDQTVIYQTQWFDHRLAVFNRTTGIFVRNIEVGPAPAHVMTRTKNDKGEVSDQVHVSQNGGKNIRELDSLTATTPNSFIRDIPMGRNPNESAHPHAHWMSADGSMMVTPNADTDDSTLYNFPFGLIADITPTGNFPIATGMMPDSSKYYVANFLDSTISVIKINQHKKGMPTATLIKTINLLDGYDASHLFVAAPLGALPIQTPVSPDGKYVIVANTLAAKILVIDTITDTIVKSLDCDAGCHGVAFGAKAGIGGGYYAYVSSKFSNRMIVVDPDPNGGSTTPNNGSNATIVGSVLLTTANPASILNDFEDTVPDAVNAGMGGQGVLPIPLVYNGFVQNLPTFWKNQLNSSQQCPLHDCN
jgi:hypothetical protein